MYPWERVIPSQDSTLRIIHEAVKRGHEVSITHPSCNPSNQSGLFSIKF